MEKTMYLITSPYYEDGLYIIKATNKEEAIEMLKNSKYNLFKEQDYSGYTIEKLIINDTITAL